MIAALILSASLALQPAGFGTTPEGEVGFDTPDGTVVTQEVYNETFADPYAEFDVMAYMFGVSSEPFVEVDVETPAAERPREFGGVELPSVAELIERAEEAADNPAFA